MQVAWEDWSDAGLAAGWSSGLSPSPSLLATEPSSPHWLYWSFTGLTLPWGNPGVCSAGGQAGNPSIPEGCLL